MKGLCCNSRVSPALAEGLNPSLYPVKVITLLTPLECVSSSFIAKAKKLPISNIHLPSTGFVGV